MLAFFKTHYWRLLFLCVCFVATMMFSVRLIAPKVILELPEDSVDERLMGQGFNEDSTQFLITRFNLKTETLTTEAWSVLTKESKQRDAKTQPTKRFNWRWYTPLGLDDLSIIYDVAWEICRKDRPEPLAYYHDLERPYLARQSPNGRFVAVESLVGMVHVIDTTKPSSLWKIPDEGIVQFSNDSQYLFTSYQTASGNQLNCWNLSNRQ